MVGSGSFECSINWTEELKLFASKSGSTDSLAPVVSNVLIDLIQASMVRRRSVCDALEALADDVCGQRSRQAASHVLEFMVDGRFGVPDDQVSSLIKMVFDRSSWHPAFEELSILLDRGLTAAHRSELSVTKGLESIVFGRIPENALDFILAAFSLVELERCYYRAVTEKLLPLATARSWPTDESGITGLAGKGPHPTIATVN